MKYLLFVILLLYSASALAAGVSFSGGVSYGNPFNKYYVSSSLGNNSYDGRAPEYKGGTTGPWANLYKVTTLVSSEALEPGDEVLLRRGDTWTVSQSSVGVTIENLNGSSSHNIVFGAYGSGVNPIITGNGVAAGTGNTLVRAGNISYVTFRDWRLIAGADTILMLGSLLDSGVNYTSGAHHLKFLSMYFENADDMDGGPEGLYFRDSFTNAYPDSNYDQVAPVHHIEVARSTFIGMGGMPDDAGTIDKMPCININAPKGGNLWYHHNFFYECADQAFYFTGEAGNIVEYNTILISHTTYTAGAMKLVSEFSKLSGMVVRENLIIGGVYGMVVQAIEDSYFYNNTIQSYDSSNYSISIGHRNYTNPVYADITGNVFKNNIFRGRVRLDGSAGEGFPIAGELKDNNTFENNFIFDPNLSEVALYNDDTTDPIYEDTAACCIATTCDCFTTDWLDGTGVTGDVNEEPLSPGGVSDPDGWTGYETPGEWTPDVGDAAVDAGQDVGLTEDLDGNPVPRGGGPDVGAYESEFTAPDEWVWHRLYLGAGGFVTGIDIHTDGTRVVRTDTAGAYKWNAVTSRWDQLVTMDSMPVGDVGIDLHAQGVYEIKIAPSDSDTMYMVYKGWVFKTTDGGDNWTRTGFSQLSYLGKDYSVPGNGTGYRLSGGKMAIDPNDADTVFVGSGHDGLWVTDAGGTNWTSIPTGEVPHGAGSGDVPGVLGICFQDSSTVYAASWANGVYQGDKDGDWTTPTGNWTEIDDGSGNPDQVLDGLCDNGYYYAIDGTVQSGAVWRFEDATDTWTEVGTNYISSASNRASAIAADPDHTDRIAVVTDYGHVFVSEDAGDTWETDTSWYYAPYRSGSDVAWHDWANAADPSYLSIADIMFDDTAGNGYLFAAQGIGVWYTDIDTEPATYVTWTGLSSGIENMVNSEIMVPPDESTVYICQEDRGVMVRDEATELQTFPAKYSTNRIRHHCWGIDYEKGDPAPATPLIVAATEFEGADYSAKSSARSGDPADWTDMTNIPDATLYGGGMAVSDSNDFSGYIGANHGLYNTQDGGSTWNNITDFGDNTHHGFYRERRIVAVDHVTPTKMWFYYVGTNYLSSGCGTPDPDRGLWESNDGGANWTRLWTGYITTCARDAYDGALRTVPGKSGEMFWTTGDVGGGEPEAAAYFRRSQNEGDDWTTIPDILEVKDFGFGSIFSPATYPRLYIAGWYDDGGGYDWGIYYSDNAGEATVGDITWTKIGDYPFGIFDRVNSVEGSKDGTERVYIGYEGTSVVYAER